jgi:hypothetical protein
LPRIVETAQIADLGGGGHRHEKRSAALGLIGFHDRRHRPARYDRDKLLLQSPQPRYCFLYRLDCVLEHDLLRRMREALARQPAPVCQGPVLAAVVDAAVLQQKRQQLLALAAQLLGRRFTGAAAAEPRSPHRAGWS